jgi:rRNA pseudouridine-1189 N-methylase Emg1 (Nep1/Mra1 family)
VGKEKKQTVFVVVDSFIRDYKHSKLYFHVLHHYKILASYKTRQPRNVRIEAEKPDQLLLKIMRELVVKWDISAFLLSCTLSYVRVI